MMRFATITFALMLSACGTTQALKPKAGEALPPKASAAKTVPTPEQLLTPDDQTRPQRTDELVRKSEKREADKFDLPPPG
jgi:hypothetical protein